MSGIDSGNPNAGQNGVDNDGGEYDTQDCPLCGTSVKLLPSHFRNHCPETGGSGE